MGQMLLSGPLRDLVNHSGSAGLMRLSSPPKMNIKEIFPADLLVFPLIKKGAPLTGLHSKLENNISEGKKLQVTSVLHRYY